VKLLDSGAIPYRKVGIHRRILLKDLKSHDDKVKKNRAKQLDFLTKQAEALVLGYGRRPGFGFR
jgi:hypothetical protein